MNDNLQYAAEMQVCYYLNLEGAKEALQEHGEHSEEYLACARLALDFKNCLNKAEARLSEEERLQLQLKLLKSRCVPVSETAA